MFSQQLEALGCDFLHVSSGGLSTYQVIATRHGYHLPFAREIRHQVKIPVIGVGLITDPLLAEALLGRGDADLIALGRAMLYNPHWPWLAAAALNSHVRDHAQYLRSEPNDVKGTLFQALSFKHSTT